jgi:hypothetical protein
LWAAVLADYELTTPETELLRQACQVADLIARLEAQLAADDLVVPGSRGQPAVNPPVDRLTTQHRVLEPLIRSMQLPFPDEDVGKRRSPAAVAAAQDRRRRERGRGPVAG